MKLYIFITFDILDMGGAQCYVDKKAEYLESQGWKVMVFSGKTTSNKKCPYPFLSNYINLRYIELEYPPFVFPQFIVKYAINNFVNTLSSNNYDEIIVESHDDKYSLWGELFAEKISGKHIFVTTNEHYRGVGKYYEEKIDFYSFKFNRGEIGTNYDIVCRLFDGYKEVDRDKVRIWIIDEDPVRDCDNENVNAIVKADYNICYIGRGSKSYVPNVISGISKFASENINKKIQFIIVGDTLEVHKNKINEILVTNKNLSIVNLGNLTPLPRSLYTKVDVVIAGSGSARCSVEEGALTLVVDAETKLCNGLLGYETFDSIYASDICVVTTVDEALNRVLIKRVQDKLLFNYPAKKGVAYCTKQNFIVIDNASKIKEYYDKKKLLKGNINLKVLYFYIKMKLYTLKNKMLTEYAW